ncbi:MAG: helix-turn-helix domain-containing protein, partial [Gammaproteobacteria bacterium]|nr:helix-turn-helix domain-containing protein [Gammaproteobacteria bacterium]
MSMNEDGSGVRPDTLALDALIKATMDRSGEDAGASSLSSSSNTLLFLGTRHTSFPTLVVQDPILEPVDKLVWMAIRIQSGETGSNRAFPSYAHIAKTANVSSTATISRAIAILRATRWLTLCARVRGVNGRFQGNAYVLHDEPLPLVDAIHLDSTYMQFLGESVNHRHARVKAVARGVLDTIDEDIEAGRNVCADEHPILRRVEATELVQKDMPRRFFAFSAKVMTDLRSYSPGEDKNRPDHQGQNLNAGEDRVQNLHPQNFKTGSCSSYINITTTTNNSSAQENFVVNGDGRSP